MTKCKFEFKGTKCGKEATSYITASIGGLNSKKWKGCDECVNTLCEKQGIGTLMIKDLY